MSSRARSAAARGGVGDEVAVDGVADLALERAQSLLVGLALSDASVEVGAAVGVGLAELADGGHVQRVVDVAVPSGGEAVDGATAGGELKALLHLGCPRLRAAVGVMGEAGGMKRRRPDRPVRQPSSAFAGYQFPPEVILLAVRWYLRYGLSYRDLEELLAERGIEVDHVTLYRWVQRVTPLIIDTARPCRHAVGDRWFVDETYVKVAGT